MQLFDNPASPFCRKVKVLLHETGQADAVDLSFCIGHPTSSERMPIDRNPLGKLPTLLLDDGRALYDSRVICRYLDARAGAGLYPAEPALWDTLVLEALADGILDAAVLIVYEARCRPEEIRSDDWVAGQWSKIVRGLDALGGAWRSHLEGPLDTGQIAAGCALGYLDFRHPGRDWRAGRDWLAGWFETFGARPSMQATLPQG